MAISRRQMSSIFLKDADRQRQIKEQMREKARNAVTISDRLIGGVVGGATGFVTSGFNPAGAAAGAIRGVTSGKKGLESVIDSGISGFTAGQVAGPKGLEAITDVTKAPQLLEAATGDPKKALQQVATRKLKEQAQTKAQKLEKIKAERDQEFKKEIEQIRQTGDVELQKLRGKQAKELQQLKTESKPPKTDKTKKTPTELTNDLISSYRNKIQAVDAVKDDKKRQDLVMKTISEVNKLLSIADKSVNITSKERDFIKGKYRRFLNELQRLKDGTLDIKIPALQPVGGN